MTDAFDDMTAEQLRHVAREMNRALTNMQTVSTRQCNSIRGLSLALGRHGARTSPTKDDGAFLSVLVDVAGEVWSANCKWGTPADHANRPDGCGNPDQVSYEVFAKDRCERAGAAASWAVIADEEWAEAAAAKDTESLKVELRQCAAVAIRWLQAIAIREASK